MALIGTWLLVCTCLFLGLIFTFVRFKPKNHPPGPLFRVPLLGNGYILFGNATKNISNMRKRLVSQNFDTVRVIYTTANLKLP